MTRYREEVKYTIIKRMMPPNNESVSTIARETGLSEGASMRQKDGAPRTNF